MASIWDSAYSDAAKFGGLYLVYATVAACYVEKFSDVIKPEGAAVSATALTTIFKAGEKWGEQEGEPHIKKLCRVEILLVFGMMDMMTRDLLTHEMGHAVAAKTFFTDANPTITVFPFSGGVTRYYKSGITPLGKALGKNNVSLIITAAGPLASQVTGLALITIAHVRRKENPELSEMLNTAAAMTVISHSVYASEALFKTYGDAHDFARLSRGGFHPLPVIVGMVATPMLLKIGLNSLEENPEN